MSTHMHANDRIHHINCFAFVQELKEPEDIMQMQPVCEPPCDTQPPENVPDPCKTQNCTRKHKVRTYWLLFLLIFHFVHLPHICFVNCTSLSCTLFPQCLNMLKLTLNMGVVIGMGLVMLWFATDQADWLSQMTFF